MGDRYLISILVYFSRNRNEEKYLAGDSELRSCIVENKFISEKTIFAAVLNLFSVQCCLL